MRLAILFLALGFLMPAWGAVLTVPDTHATIQAAIDAASEGDRIEIKAGIYQECLRAKSGIELAGEGPDKVFVQGSTLKGVLFLAEKCTSGKISGISFEHTDRETGDKRQWPDLFLVRDSALSVSQCAFKNSAGCGILVEGASHADIAECTVTGCVQAGILARDEACEVTLHANTCNENGWEGIGVYTSAKAAISETTCLRNQSSGIHVMSKATAVLQKNHVESNAYGILFGEYATGEAIDNTCIKNTQMGMAIYRGAKATYRGNTVEDNTRGIEICGPVSEGIVADNTCRRNAKYNIGVNSAGTSTLENNTCEESEAYGIVMGQWATRATVTGNHCNRNGKHGICFMTGSEGEARANTCDANKGAGVCIMDEGTTATADANTCTNNSGGETITEPGDPASLQDQLPSDDDMEWACTAGEFAWLEMLASRAREHKTRQRDGRQMLYHFYEEVAWADEEDQGKILETYERWRAAYPNSVTPLIVLAQYYRNLARDQWHNIRPSERRKKTEANFDLAGGCLKQAEQLNIPDPHLYVVCLNVAAGRPGASFEWLAENGKLTMSWGKGPTAEEVRTLFEKGVAVDRTYIPLYGAYAEAMLPENCGRPGDYERIMAETADATRDILGNQIYTHLAYYLAWTQPRARFSTNKYVDRGRVYAGCDELLAAFPEPNRYTNMYCHLACLYKDQPKARELFDKIGADIDEDFWPYEDDFRAYKQWAYGLAKYPPASDPEEQINEITEKITKGTPFVGVIMLLVALALIAIIVARNAPR